MSPEHCSLWLLRIKQGLRDGSADAGACCSSRGPESSAPVVGGSQPAVMPVPGALTHRHTDRNLLEKETENTSSVVNWLTENLSPLGRKVLLDGTTSVTKETQV